MKNTSTIVNAAAVIVAFIFAGMGCTPAANSNTSNTNKNSNTVAASNAATPAANVNTAPAAETNADPAAAVGSLATPSDAYRTAYDMRKRKDAQGLKKIMSPDLLEFFTMMGEVEKKSLDDMIKEMCDKPQANKAEVRNEVIKGNLAAVQYLNEAGEWKSMDFEKIGGKWMLSAPKADSPDPSAKKSK